MAFYYNPITGDIKKISKDQKKAYDEHFREGRATSVIESFFGNETTFPALVSLFTIISGGALFGWFLNVLFGYVKEEGSEWSTATKETVSNAITGTKYGSGLIVNLFLKPLTGKGQETVPLPSGVSAPVSVTYDDLWDYAQKKYLFKDYFRQ